MPLARTMRAAVLREISQPLLIEDVPMPEFGADEVLVATRTCGICRTDLHIQDGLAYVPALPHIPGHEPAGVVAAVGANVRGVAVGDRVVPHLFVSHRECRYSRSGQHAQALHATGILGVTLPGGFAEYFALPAANVIPLPNEVPFDVGGLASCALVTAVHAYRQVHLGVGELAVVVGAGGIGLVLVQLLSASGVRVVGVSRSPDSLRLATAAGAVEAIALDDANLAARIRALAGESHDGAAAIFETVGNARTMALSARMAARGGSIVVIGEEPEFPAIDTITIAQRELRIIGSRNGGRQDAVDALDLVARGVLRPVIAARFDLTEINEALALLRGGQAHGRVIIQVARSD
jgi:D-arabinose 1-dehydrogenase-like Zn-dependent alcohol dehydrogenase